MCPQLLPSPLRWAKTFQLACLVNFTIEFKYSSVFRSLFLELTTLFRKIVQSFRDEKESDQVARVSSVILLVLELLPRLRRLGGNVPARPLAALF